MIKHWFAAVLAMAALSQTAPAFAEVIVITQEKALSGGVTPGDGPGFPVLLSRGGSYRFDSDLIVSGDRIGIVATSRYVNIDMNGFVLNGGNVADTGLYSSFGISSIRNGIITGFQEDGISLIGSNSSSWVVENMQIVRNGRRGIAASGSSSSRYLNNSILFNGKDGISCGNYCHVAGNMISANRGSGVTIISGTVLGNTIFSNSDFGVDDYSPPRNTGIGNNSIFDNFAGGGRQTRGTIPLQPNGCAPTPCE